MPDRAGKTVLKKVFRFLGFQVLKSFRFLGSMYEDRTQNYDP